MPENAIEDNLDEILSHIESLSTEAVEQNNTVTFSDYERQERELGLALKREQLQSQQQDRQQRRQFAEKIFWVVVFYLFAVIVIVILNGIKNVLSIKDSVLIALLGTTTANVISLLVIVAKYLFHSKE